LSQGRTSRFLDIAVMVVALGMACYHLVSTQYLIWGIQEHAALHLLLALVLVSLCAMKAQRKRWLWFLPLFVGIAGIAVCSYMIIRADYLRLQPGYLRSILDWIMAGLLVVVVVEAAREVWGWVLPSVCVIFTIYFFLGDRLPPPFGHSPYSPEYVLSLLGLGWRGIFEYMFVSANFMFLFILFGGLLGALGAPKFFMQAGKVASRFLAGGAAQTSVVSSALVGMVMGQAVSNVIVTGAFTIPLMKKTGYTPEQAGAIEATASSGGQIMPPVMGEAVFLMSSLIAVAYFDLCIAAFIPAILYFLSVALGVQVLAYKNRIPRPKEKVEWSETIRWAPVFVVPLVVLIVILAMRYTPMYAAFFAIITVLVVPFLRKSTRPSIIEIAKGFRDGAVAGANIAIAVAVVGLLIQTVITSGLGWMIAAVVEDVCMGQLWLALIITMFISLILGIGVPTLPAYALVATIVAPMMVKMGVPLIAAHLFCFWFAVFSTLTPPVAFASMAGSVLAGGSFMKTSIVAFRLAMAGYILPYLMVYCPILIMQPEAPLETLTVFIAIVAGLAVLQVILFGHFFVRTSVGERLLFVLAGAGLLGFCFTKMYILFGVGILLFLALTFWQWRRKPVLEEVEVTEKLQSG
jgi:TRAP transporter 4TM/12TM fusion protein